MLLSLRRTPKKTTQIRVTEFDTRLTKANQDQKVETKFIDTRITPTTLVVKKLSVTSLIMNDKMPMFAKVFLISFAHDVIDVFVFPKEHVKDIFAKNHIYFLVLYVKFNV